MTGILGAVVGFVSTSKINTYGTVGSKVDKLSTPLAVAVTSSTAIPAGTLLVLGICVDNATATTPTVTIANTGGVAWTSIGSGSSGATATSGAGIFLYTYTLLTTASIASNATITTVTFSALGSAAAKAIAVWGFTGMTNTLRGTPATGTSTAGTPSATTTGTALVAGDLIIGVIGGEADAVPTRDADTLNGSWSVIYGVANTGGNANANTTVGMQYKVVTATGAQTWNPTTVNDSVATVFSLVPA